LRKHFNPRVIRIATRTKMWSSLCWVFA